LDVMHARGPSALPPGIIPSSPGHPPFPAFAYNGLQHIAALPGRATGNRAVSPGTLQAALTGGGSAFHAPSSSAVRLGGRPPVTTVVTSSAGTTSTSAADNALQRLAAQAAQQHIHSLQLDWLARAGVYMPRLIEYNGRLVDSQIAHACLSFMVKLEMSANMPNVITALRNIGGALCSTPQSLADAKYWSAVQ